MKKSAIESPHVIIEPTRGWVALNLKELWAYRELTYFLTWRDIKVRYKQTGLGVMWAVFQPLLTMLVFTLFFGRLARVPSDGIPYPIFTYCALLAWQLFAYGLTNGGNSLVASQNLVTKIYFPRLIIPLSSVLCGVLDFAFAFTLFVPMSLHYGITPTVKLLLLPVFLMLAVFASLGPGLWLSALNVKYRDVRHTLPFLTQLWMFATPVAYPSSLVPAKWHVILALNPMTGVVDGFRWTLLNTPLSIGRLAISLAVIVTIFISGLYYFRQVERTFADVV